MAYEQETKSGGLAQAVGAGLQGLGSGLMDFAKMRQEAEQKAAELKQRQSYYDDLHAKSSQEITDYAWGVQGETLYNAAQSDDPEAAVDLSSSRLQQASDAGKIPFNLQTFKDTVVKMSKVMKPAFLDIAHNMSVLGSESTKPDIADSAYKTISNKINQIRSVTPIGMGGMVDAIQKHADALQAQRLKGDTATTMVNMKNQSSGTNQFGKTIDIETAKSFNKQLDTLPAMENQEANLNKVLGVLDKGTVKTGPLAGLNYSQFLQKLGPNSEDAQVLENFLAKENVIKIMEFAKSAGVRAIDTEQEQARLLKSIANAKQSPAVMRKTVSDMINTIQESKRVIQEKQDYINQNGNLRGYLPSPSPFFGKGKSVQASGSVKVQGSNGKIYNVPAEHLQEVLKANPGAKQVE